MTKVNVNLNDFAAVGVSPTVGADGNRATAKVETDGTEAWLVIEYAGKAISIKLPADDSEIEMGADILMRQLAGIDKMSLVSAGMLALVNIHPKSTAAKVLKFEAH